MLLVIVPKLSVLFPSFLCELLSATWAHPGTKERINDHDQVLATWELFEQHVIRRFHSPSIDPNPSLRSLILWLHRFGVSIMGIDPREALIRDLMVKINHKRFDTHA